ncbi:MAG: carboxypeptidase-like regulatory domain-containing protein [Gemmatimonadaceae bacterium]
MPLLAATPLDAQRVLRGRIISAESRLPMTDALVDALDSARRVLVSARSDSAGRFTFAFGSDPGGFQIRIRRLGIEPTLTDPLRFDGRDTVEVDLLVDERPAVLEEVTVDAGGPSPLNAQRLRDAYARGWRVVSPERVAEARQRATNLDQLIRSVSLANIMVSQDCLRSLVTNGCLTVFIDDVYFGQRGFNAINTRDIEFIAVIGPTEALTRYGNRAQYGVLMLYTRRHESRNR